MVVAEYDVVHRELVNARLLRLLRVGPDDLHVVSIEHRV